MNNIDIIILVVAIFVLYCIYVISEIISTIRREHEANKIAEMVMRMMRKGDES